MKKFLPSPEGLRDNMWANVLWLALGAAVTGASAAMSWYKDLSPYLQWGLFTAAISFSAIGVGMVVYLRLTRDRGRGPHTIPEDSPHAPVAPKYSKLANPESAERLRELSDPVLRTAQFAYEFFLAGIPTPKSSLDPNARDVVRSLLEAYPAPALCNAIEDASNAVLAGGQWTEDQLGEALVKVDEVILQYIYLATWLSRSGPIMAGSMTDYLSNPKLRELVDRHRLLLSSLKTAKSRSDINFVARRLKDLEKLFVDGSDPDAVSVFSVEPVIADFGGLYPDDLRPERKLAFAFQSGHPHPYFAVKVTNNSTVNLPTVIGRLFFADREFKPGVWLRVEKGEFSTTGERRTELAPGESKYMLVARAEPSTRYWVRLSDTNMVPIWFLQKPIEDDGRIRFMTEASDEDRDITIGQDSEAVVRLMGQGADQSTKFRMYFDGGSARVERLS